MKNIAIVILYSLMLIISVFVKTSYILSPLVISINLGLSIYVFYKFFITKYLDNGKF